MTYKDLTAKEKKDFNWLDDESKKAELIRRDGRIFFKPNQAILFARQQISLNGLWACAAREGWPMRDLMRFYRGMGYSLCGFGEIFDEEKMKQADMEVKR